jgi:hypothetical protein
MASVALPGPVPAELSGRASLRDQGPGARASGCPSTLRASCSSHGAPVTGPDDTPGFLDRATGVSGFFGAPGIEVLPTEVSITADLWCSWGIVRTLAAADERPSPRVARTAREE